MAQPRIKSLPPNSHNRALKSNVTFSKSPRRIMPRFRPWQWLLFALLAKQPARLRRWRWRTYSAPQRRGQ